MREIEEIWTDEIMVFGLCACLPLLWDWSTVLFSLVVFARICHDWSLPLHRSFASCSPVITGASAGSKRKCILRSYTGFGLLWMLRWRRKVLDGSGLMTAVKATRSFSISTRISWMIFSAVGFRVVVLSWAPWTLAITLETILFSTTVHG